MKAPSPFSPLLKQWEQSLWRCNKCGACTGACPLYARTKDEGMAARGKLALVEALLEGSLAPGPGCAAYLAGCLLCQACRESCASGVPTTEIILAARRELALFEKLPFALRLLLSGVLTRPALVALAGRALELCRRQGICRLAERVLPGEFFPLLWRALLAAPALPGAGAGARGLLPEAAGESSLARPARGTVGYFTGCALTLFFPRVSRATQRALARAGWAAAPRNFCCGMPHYAHGDFRTARELARKNIDLFASYAAVVTDCATCGAMLKEYAQLLADDKEYAPKAKAFSARVRDVSEFLAAEGAPDPERFPRPFPASGPAGHPGFFFFRKERIRAAYHDPCHLARGQGVREEPRRLLAAVPGLELVEMESADTCCGGGGTFLFTHLQLAAGVGEAKARDILAAGPDVVVTGCPGCLLQLKMALQRAGRGDLPVLHTVELLGL